MKIPRLTVRKLMLAILVFATGWWTVVTVARWESYRIKAAGHARREKRLRDFQKLWREAGVQTEILLKDKVAGGKGDIVCLNDHFMNLYDQYACSQIPLMTRTLASPDEPDGWIDRLNDQSELARQNEMMLVPLVEYHEMLKKKYERAMKEPWTPVPPDAPEPIVNEGR